MEVITYPCWDSTDSMSVKRTPTEFINALKTVIGVGSRVQEHIRAVT